MIGRIRGTLIEKKPPVLMVEAGYISYELQASLTTFYNLPEIGNEVILHTHLLVREDMQSLYAFSDKREKELFRYLIRINGVGPKLALTILSGVDADTFVNYVMDSNISTLVRLPGIGKKTAERLLIEMKDYLQNWDIENKDGFNINQSAKDAIDALIALGYKPHAASKAIKKYSGKALSSEELIRLALKEI